MKVVEFVTVWAFFDTVSFVMKKLLFSEVNFFLYFLMCVCDVEKQKFYNCSIVLLPHNLHSLTVTVLQPFAP